MKNASEICKRIKQSSNKLNFLILFQKVHAQMLIHTIKHQEPKYQPFDHITDLRQSKEGHNQLYHKMFAFY